MSVVIVNPYKIDYFSEVDPMNADDLNAGIGPRMIAIIHTVVETFSA
jgi:hypothetical protein